jgi:hypothetical protein
MSSDLDSNHIIVVEVTLVFLRFLQIIPTPRRAAHASADYSNSLASDQMIRALMIWGT